MGTKAFCLEGTVSILVHFANYLLRNLAKKLLLNDQIHSFMTNIYVPQGIYSLQRGPARVNSDKRHDLKSSDRAKIPTKNFRSISDSDSKVKHLETATRDVIKFRRATPLPPLSPPPLPPGRAS